MKNEESNKIVGLEETLLRMLIRVSKDSLSSKCLIMVHLAQEKELVAIHPALGFDGIDLSTLRVADTSGISGQAFTEVAPVVFHDAVMDHRAATECWVDYGVQNGICVPLIINHRDEETNDVIKRETIGVFHILNKQFKDNLTEEDVAADVMLLERSARLLAPLITKR